jgi:hypothetical protein
VVFDGDPRFTRGVRGQVMLSKDVKDSGVIHVDFGEKIGHTTRLELAQQLIVHAHS